MYLCDELNAQLAEDPNPQIGVALATSSEDLLRKARERGVAAGVKFAGLVSPFEAWALFRRGIAEIIDVRSVEECKYVGHVPDALHLPWATGLAMKRNPRFLDDLEAMASKDEVVLFLCRSAKRSAEAAEAAAQAGFVHAYNVLEGFEGDIDSRQHRGDINGWRRWGLPWAQD
jgi:rhodanese-related sulfurtransferase